MNDRKEWHYYDDVKNEWSKEFSSLRELDELRHRNLIRDDTLCISRWMRKLGPGSSPIQFSSIARLDIEFEPSTELLATSRASAFVTVLSGPNNSGKTVLLKELCASAGLGSFLVSCNRFSHVDVLSSRKREDYQYQNLYGNFIQNLIRSRQNTEENEFKLEQVIAGLKNVQRNLLFDICKDILGNTFSLKRTEADNDLSPFYIDMDGENLKYGSSGTRLLITLLGTMLNENFRALFIDEPEIGLSPRSQAAVADLLFDPKNKAKYWSHLSKVFIATHSHLFLDRRVIGNNFVVRKNGSKVTTKAVASIADFHQLQFNMLGNEFEALFLPSAIVLVEGVSDATFLARLFALGIPEKRVAVVRCGGDGRILEKLETIGESLGKLSMSPFRPRVLVWLDATHTVPHGRIVGAGVLPENLLVSTKNGIEYEYPASQLAMLFRCEASDVEKIDREKDPIVFNQIEFSKKLLASNVTEKLDSCNGIGSSAAALLTRVREVCG